MQSTSIPVTGAELKQAILPTMDIHGNQAAKSDLIRQSDELTNQLVSCLELHRKVLEVAPVGLLLYDQDGQCVVANDMAAKLLGCTRDDLRRENYRHIQVWRDSGLSALVDGVDLMGTAEQREVRYQSPSGCEFWLDVRATPVIVNAETYLLLVIDDISRQKAAEQRLVRHQTEQEEIVQERVRELQKANALLRQELTEKKHFEERIQYQATLLQNISDAVIASDLSCRITEWNPAAEALYGWSANEVLGMNLTELLRTQFPSGSTAGYSEYLLEHGSWHGEVIQHHRDGHPIHILSSVTLVRDSEGKAIGAVAANRNMTASKQVEDQLRILSSAVEQSPVSIIITDTKGSIEYVNPQFTLLTGYTLDEVKGQNPRLLKSGTTSPEEYRTLWQTITAGGQWQGQLRNRAKDGTLFWEAAKISPIYNGFGQITHFVAVKEDISEAIQREQQQNALLSLAMALRAASGRDEMLPSILKQSAQMVHAPLAAFISYEASSSSLMLEAAYQDGDSIFEVAIPVSSGTEISASVLQSGEPYSSADVLRDSRFLLHDLIGDERAAACLPVIANGEPLGVLWFLRAEPFTAGEVRLLAAAADMGAVALQRAKLHDRVMRYTNDLEIEVAKRTKELADANERLKELDRLKSKFVSDVTHELRTPVTNIGLYLKLLEHKPDNFADYLPVLTGQAERLRTLVKDTLDLSRLDHNREGLNIASVDVNTLIEAVVAAHLARAEDARLTLEFLPTPGIPLIKGDHDRLTQVVTNLVANALNYTPNGRVTVSTTYDAGERMVKCAVKDTGCGIYIDDIPHLFDRFYRGRRDQTAPVPGSGLGLSIVKEIVDMHGGKIEVTSEVGFGSTFTVCLPLSQHRLIL